MNMDVERLELNSNIDAWLLFTQEDVGRAKHSTC